MSENQRMFMWVLILWVSLKVDVLLIRAKVFAPEGTTLSESLGLTLAYSVLALVAFLSSVRRSK